MRTVDPDVDLSELHVAVLVDDEVAATDQFLRTSIRLLGSMNFLGRDEYVLTAALAAGMEKLLKLTFGFIRTGVEGVPWPSREFRSFGHRIADLDGACRDLIRLHRGRTAYATQLEEAWQPVADDPYIGHVLRLAQDYALGGRFYNLDYLSAPPPAHRASPRQQWQSLLMLMWQENLDADHWWARRQSYADISAKSARNRLLQQTVSGWRHYYLTAWGLGVCGERARYLAENITDANPNWD